MATGNPLEMSDEEFLKAGTPPAAQEPQTEQPTTEPEAEEPAQEEPEGTPEPEEAKPETQEPKGEEVAAEPSGEPAADAAAEPKEGEPDPVSKPEGGQEAGKPEKPDATKEPKETADAPVTKPDYEKFYQQVMQPIKANGKTIELKSPEEAIRLMQMGAGFTKKLQDLQPVLKTVRMLEKADLLSEDKLSYLIDIHNKNPEAIKKLIKESGIDPLDLNPNDNVAYVPGNHSVSDREMAFNQAIQDIQSRDGGQDTINIITQTWDQNSISIAWENPEVLDVIQSQRESGIYPIIVAEIDRRKALGQLPPTTPFLHAYKQIGDALGAAGAFNHLNGQVQQAAPQTATPPASAQSQETQKPQPQVLATRTGQPKTTVKNGDKAQAAAPTSTTPRKAAPVNNPLAMADDEFLKQFSGRL